MVRDTLIRLNPEIRAAPDLADEVIYRLRAVFLSVRAEGLVRANELFAGWLRGERSMPFGERGEHAQVRLIDFDDPANNDYMVTSQWVYPSREGGSRFDVVLLVNGIPLVIGEVKTPVRPAVSWLDGAADIHDGYETSVPEMFVPNVFSFATEGRRYRYGSVGMPVDIWGPWHEGEDKAEGTLADVRRSVRSMLRPAVVLDILRNFTLYATDRKHRRIKVICRYQQYEGANMIVSRVLAGQTRKGLIWHFQGSGKSLLMVFASQKLRMHPTLGNPTVMIVVDRIDLDTQISATFNASDVPNMVGAATRQELQGFLAADTRKIIITTIHKFGEAEGRLNDRPNIIVMVDEAHRTQERRPRAQDARGPAERLPLRPHRHPHQQARPQHLLGLRCRGGRGRAT
jgi:type I restriction enzyme R subunit